MLLKILIPIVIVVLVNVAVHFLKKEESVQTSMHKKYLLQLTSLVVIIVCVLYMISAFDPSMKVSTILLSGSALIVAVLGFAAQPIILDIISGLLISIYKPFEIGDRIIVEGQTAGVVEDITLRHTIIQIYDSHRLIIPNSELDSKVVINSSYQMKDRRGMHLKFSVSYDTDVQKAIDVLRDCVAESPYTLGVVSDGIREDSGPVYFFTMEDSALILETTIWVSRDTNGAKAVTDVNMRVMEAFRENGIEIPYPYFNVYQFQGTKEASNPEKERVRNTVPVERISRTNTVHMLPGENKLEEALQSARHYSERQHLNPHASMQLELLTEESLGFVQRVVDHTTRDFWIEGTGMVYRIHIRFAEKVGSGEFRKLVELSSSGRAPGMNTFSSKIWNAVHMGLKWSSGKEKGSKPAYEWKLSESGTSEEEIGKSILGAVADDIRLSVKNNRVELIVSKSNGKR